MSHSRFTLAMKSFCFTLLLVLPLAAQPDFQCWNTPNGVPIQQSPYFMNDHKFAVQREGDHRGEYAVVWSDCRRGDRDIYIQAFTPDHEPLFTEGGLLVAGSESFQSMPVIFTDADGWLVAWPENRTENETELCISKIDFGGRILWGDAFHPIVVSRIDGNRTYGPIKINSDGGGGAIICWAWESWEAPLYIQHISSEGELDRRWQEEGIAVRDSAYSSKNVKIIFDENHDFFIVSFVCDNGPFWKKFDLSGEALFSGSFFEGLGSRYNVIEDRNGGFYSAFRSWGNIRVQHIDSQGQALWGENGTVLFQNRNGGELFYDGAGSAICVSRIGDGRSLAMKFGGDGELERLWDNEVELEFDPYDIRCAAFNGESWFYQTDSNGVNIQYVASDGAPFWNEATRIQFGEDGWKFPQVLAFEDHLTVFGIAQDTSGFEMERIDINSEGDAEEELSTLLLEGLNWNPHGLRMISVSEESVGLIWLATEIECDKWSHWLPGRQQFQYQVLRNDGDNATPIVPVGGASLFDEVLINPNLVNASPDGAGGFYAVASLRDGENWTVSINHIDSDGEKLWGPQGAQVNVAVLDTIYRNLDVVSNINGGGYAGWFDGSRVPRLSHFGVDGQRLWNMDIAPFDSAVSLGSIKLLSSGEDVVAFVTSSRDKSRANRLNPEGRRLWGDQGIPLCPRDRFFRSAWNFIPLSDGFASTHWVRNPAEEPESYHLIAQVFMHDGEKIFEEEIFQGAVDSVAGKIGLTSAFGDEIWIASALFPEQPANHQIVLHRLEPFEGNNYREAFQHGGIVVSSLQGLQEFNMISDGAGGIYIAWVNSQTDDILTLRLDHSGQPVPGWNPSGISVCTAKKTFEIPQLTLFGRDGSDGLAVAWLDFRSELTAFHGLGSIHAQRLDDGAHRVPSVPDSAFPLKLGIYSASPNPFNSMVKLTYSVRQASLPVRLTIHDISGRELIKLVDGKVNTGAHEVVFDGTAFPAGIYFARLETGDDVHTVKMVLVR